MVCNDMGFPQMKVTQKKQIPIQMDDLGVPIFVETSILVPQKRKIYYFVSGDYALDMQ